MRLVLSKIIIIKKWFESFKSKSSILPIKMRWNLARDMKQIDDIAQEYEVFRSSLSQDVRKEFFTDKKSTEFNQYKTDESGNPLIGEDGKQATERARKIKPEFLDEFQNEMNSINSQLTNILSEEHEITLYSINLDDFIDKLPDDVDLTIEDLEMLATFQKVS